MRRTRRKPRVIWLPVHGRNFSTVPEDDTSWTNGIGGEFIVPSTGELITDVQAVTFDYSDSASNEEGTDFRSLHELAAGNAYRLRRIVGKFHAGACIDPEAQGTNGIPLLEVGAGFCINRTDPDGNLPNIFTVTPKRGPLHQDAAEDPWIWRRVWHLSPIPRVAGIGGLGISTLQSQVQSIQTVLGENPQWPQTTAEYGSVQDGPHIDQKTARVIGAEERLFFWVQARVSNGDAQIPAGMIVWNLDLRILASLRSQVGNRRNASR